MEPPFDDTDLDGLLSSLAPDETPPDVPIPDLTEPSQHTEEEQPKAAAWLDPGSSGGVEAEDGPWTRLDGETAVAYAAFCVYRDLGPGRSLDAAYRKHKGQQKGNKRATGHWTRWYSKFDWKTRAEAYDAHLELLARRGREAAYIQDLQRFQERQKKLSQATLGAAIRLLQKAGERLQALDADEIPPQSLPAYFRAAAAVAEAATNAEATALGLHELITLLDARDTDENA